jgi:hypothetical protein
MGEVYIKITYQPYISRYSLAALGQALPDHPLSIFSQTTHKIQSPTSCYGF